MVVITNNDINLQHLRKLDGPETNGRRIFVYPRKICVAHPHILDKPRCLRNYDAISEDGSEYESEYESEFESESENESEYESENSYRHN